MPKKVVAVLGATGNLGQQIIPLLQKYHDHYEVAILSGHYNKSLLMESAKLFPQARAILTTSESLILEPKIDIVINLISGLAGIEPTINALKSGKTLLAANKESITACGQEINSLRQPGQLIPLDSEHNAIHEILKQHPEKEIEEVIVPCSGGPFLYKTRAEIENAELADALLHPKWKMGPKITLESALLINKGLEVIETHYLFNLPLKKIKIKIHPECQIHGVVKFKNHPALAYVSEPNMSEHLENALREAVNLPTTPHIVPLESLPFVLADPDHDTFPGAQIVLKSFQKAPERFIEFLKREERWITKLLQNDEKINFTELKALADE